MTTQRQHEIDRVFQRALREFGEGTDTVFLIAVTSERTNPEYGEIVEALEAVHSMGHRADILSDRSLREGRTR